MPIEESVLVELVKEATEQLRDPSFSQLAVGSFVQAQPDASRYLSAHTRSQASGETLVQAVFHLQLICRCLERLHGAPPARVSFDDLDRAYQEDSLKGLSELEPALADYLMSNVDNSGVRDVVAQVTLALLALTPRATNPTGNEKTPPP